MNTLNILIVEDDLLTQKIHCIYLDKLDCTYTVASNGKEALQLCENENFDSG